MAHTNRMLNDVTTTVSSSKYARLRRTPVRNVHLLAVTAAVLSIIYRQVVA